MGICVFSFPEFLTNVQLTNRPWDCSAFFGGLNKWIRNWHCFYIFGKWGIVALCLCGGGGRCCKLPQFLQPRKITNIFFSLLDHEKNHLQAYLLCVQNLFPPLCWYIWHILHVLQDYYPRFNTYLSLSFSYSAKSHHIHYIFYQRLFLDNERLKMHLWFGSAHLFDSKTVDFWQWANNVVALSIPNTSIHISDRD